MYQYLFIYFPGQIINIKYLLIKRQYSIFLSDWYLIVVLDSSLQVENLFLMKMESKIDQKDDYFFGNFEIQFQIQNLKLALVYFSNTSQQIFRFLILEKKNYQAKLLSVFQYLIINLNVLRNFMTLYWATSWTTLV